MEEMEGMEGIATLIEYFELNDGEVFGIQQVSQETGELLDQIVIDRETALEIAEYINNVFGNAD